jgi:hypothetical protein
MADFYAAKQLSDIMASHQQAVAGVEGAAKQMGDLTRRSVQLWAMAASLVDESERASAGQRFAADAAARWETNRTNLVTAIDGLALSTGLTRKDILDSLAAAPETVFA